MASALDVQILSENPDGTAFLIVGAGISPAEADIIFVSRDAAGGTGQLSEYVARELGVKASAFWGAQPGDAGLAYVGGKIIAHLTTVGGDGDTETLLSRNLASLLYEQLDEITTEKEGVTLWFPLMGTGAGGLTYTASAHIIGREIAGFLASPAIETRGIHQIIISGGPDMDPSELASVVRAVDSFGIGPEVDPPETKADPPLAQNADFRSDRPVTDLAEDALDRGIVARAIYEKVKAFWTEDGGPPPRYPFMVHVAGRWGSGKSTILNFLGQILKEDESLTPPRTGQVRETRKNWVIVSFNAWQHQAQRPVWWSLLNAVADQAAEQMDPAQARWFNNRNRYFRFRMDRGLEYTFVGIAAFVLVLGVLWYTSLNGAEPGPDITATVETTTTTDDPIDPDGAPSVTGKVVEKRVEVTEKPAAPKGDTDIESLILKIAALVTAVGTIWTALQKFFQRTQDTADALVALDDTTAPLKQRFEEMIREIHRPVAIFIDDLDRCDADYVIELLQAIQTIYVDVPVLYVVAADRDWIVSAYDQTYKGFKTDIDRPGQPLGYLFVKKIFQLSVNVPDLDSDYGKSFLMAQLQDKDEEKVDPAEAARIRAAVQAAPTLAAAQDIIESQPTLSTKRIAGSEGFLKSLAPEAQAEVEHLLVNKLTEGEMLLDPNPRAIKRLVNAYSFRSGFALSAGQTHVIPKLPYWCVLDLRFPYSAERLAAVPTLVEGDAWKSDGMTPVENGAFINPYFPLQDQEEIAKILAHLTADDIKDLRLYG